MTLEDIGKLTPFDAVRAALWTISVVDNPEDQSEEECKEEMEKYFEILSTSTLTKDKFMEIDFENDDLFDRLDGLDLFDILNWSLFQVPEEWQRDVYELAVSVVLADFQNIDKENRFLTLMMAAYLIEDEESEQVIDKIWEKYYPGTPRRYPRDTYFGEKQ